MVILLVAGSCSKDETPDYFVDAPLQPYFDSFEAEAAQRGVTIDLEALRVSGDVRLIGTINVIGQCVHTEKEPNTIIVDVVYWNSAEHLEKEFLIFHELGHCALNRDHIDDSDANGDCISIMTSGTGLCHINYTEATRSALLDELFTP